MVGLIRRKIGLKVAVLTSGLLLVVILVGSFFLIQFQKNSLENELLKRGRIESMLGAEMISKILEESVDNGVFKIDDLFDTNYQEIPGFEPAKYHTKYDSYLDKSILSIEDMFLKDDSNIFAIAVDRYGYCPVHNTVFQKPVTGDMEADKVDNRTKRLFNDRIGIKAAKNMIPGFRQVYTRDTGEELWDISSPIMVRGRHWGGFRIGISLEKIQGAKIQQTVKLSLIMGCILLFSLISVFGMVNNALAPLHELTTAAENIANGNVEEAISMGREDEVGKIANAVERLRISLKAAMSRLKKQAA